MHKRKILPAKAQDQEALENLARSLNVAPLVLGVLFSRGITEKEQIEKFLYGSKTPYHDPFLLQDMSRAAERILQALRLKEKITVYGDYDVDGITASSLLYLFLQEQGAKVDVYIPRRDSEGYGLNSGALETLAKNGTTLVITVDSGISGAKEVATKPAGLDIIITDHHMPPEELPQAFAVVNPHRKDDRYPFKDLAGVGVSFKLCQALYQKCSRCQDFWLEHLDLVALGTIADMVPLQGENRELVRAGLKVLNATKNLGLKALIAGAGFTGKPITGGTVGFTLAPRLNAVGRLDDALDGVKLLTSENEQEANNLAKMLNEENITRQGISQKIFEEADAMLTQGPRQEWGIVLYKEDWHAGVIGIAASRLVEKYDLPVILLTKDGDKAKGSCRSIPPLNLYEALNNCQEYLMQFGGHKQAAGLTLALDKIADFRRAFQEQVKKLLQGQKYIPSIMPDYYFSPRENITPQAVKDLALLEPCGMGNPSGIFAFACGTVTNVAVMGKEQEHLRVSIANGSSQYTGLLWHQGSNAAYFYEGEEAAWAFAPRLNYYQGRELVNLQVMACVPKRGIVDFRTGSLAKGQIIKSILQNGQKTVVYLSKKTDFPPDNFGENLILAEPEKWETVLSPDVKQVILYDLSGANLLLTPGFFLANWPQIDLYLCYSNSEVDQAKVNLVDHYYTAEGLRLCYKYIHGKLGGGKIEKAAVLGTVLESGQVINSEVLTIFQELGFINSDNEVLSLVSTKHNDLTNSATYNRLEKAHKEKLSEYNRIKNITCREIAALWQ